MLIFVYSEDSLDWKDYGAEDIVPISQLIYKDRYHMKADGTQVSGE